MAVVSEGNGGAGLRNVLVLTPTPSHRTTQGNRRRIRRVCEALQHRGCRIHFVYFPWEWNGTFNHGEYAAMKAAWDSLHIVAYGSPPPHRTDAPHWGIDDWWDEAIGRYLSWLCSVIPMDMAIVNYAFLSKAFEYLPPCTLKVLDTHDRLSDRRELLEANAIAPEFFYTTRDEEAKALDRADIVLAIKDEERLFFETLTRRPVLTLGHFEPPPAGRPEAETALRPEAEPLRFGLIGSNNSINRENFARFLAVALPIFRAAGARLRLLIGGTISHSFTAQGGMEDYVEVVGPVGDVADFYRRIDVSLNPFDFSTGLKIKVAEALAHGSAVIGTRNAFEGIATDLPEHRIDRLDDLARFCLTLADEPARVVDLRNACRAVYRGLGETVNAALDRLVALAPPQILAVADLRDDRAPPPRVEAWLRLLDARGHTTLLLTGPDAPNLRAWLADRMPRIEVMAAGGTPGPATLADRVHDEASRRRAALVVLLAAPVGIPWRPGPWKLLVDMPDSRNPAALGDALAGVRTTGSPVLVVAASPLAAQLGPAALPGARFAALPDPLPATVPPPPAELRTVHVMGAGSRHQGLFERLAALLSGGRRSTVRTVLIDAGQDGEAPSLRTPTRRITQANPAAVASGWVPPPDLLIDLGSEKASDGAVLDGLRARALGAATPTLVLGADWRREWSSAGALGLLTAEQLLPVVETLRQRPELLARLAQDRREAGMRLGIDAAWRSMAKTVAGLLAATAPVMAEGGR